MDQMLCIALVAVFSAEQGALIKKNVLNYFESGTGVQEKMSFKPSCLARQNHLGYFGRRNYDKHFCEIILYLDQ